MFDNEDGGFGAELDFSEISIARRLARGGEGQYLVNRAPVRRTDLVELLADVGLGGSMHSIVGQGKVEAVLASKPEDRRALVEEAAGLGKFKRRRHRAELKLARVAAQVERARDVEEEVRKRLRPLALQATAAERAEKLAHEVASLRARVARLDLAVLESGGPRRRNAGPRQRSRAGRRRSGSPPSSSERESAEIELSDAAGRQRGGGRGALPSAGRRRASRGARGVGRRGRRAAARRPGRGQARRGSPKRRGASRPRGRRPGRRRRGPRCCARERPGRRARPPRARPARSGRASRGGRGGATPGGDPRRARGGRPGARRARRRPRRGEPGARRARRGPRASSRTPRERNVSRQAAPGRARDRPRERAEAVRRRPVELEQRANEARAVSPRVAPASATTSPSGRARRGSGSPRSSGRSRNGKASPPAARALAAAGERLAVAALEVEPGLERAVAAALAWRASALLATDRDHGLALLERARSRRARQPLGRSPLEPGTPRRAARSRAPSGSRAWSPARTTRCASSRASGWWRRNASAR